MSTPLSPHGIAALAAAKHGYHVFPLWGIVHGHCACPKGRACPRPGKHPRLADWQDAATTDLDQIVRWWRTTPLSNVAIACGKSRIFIVDIDPERGGEEEFRDLIAAYGQIPATVEAITGSGGRHLYFRSPGGISNHSPFNAIDIRGNGGYVVAPGSLHASGDEYHWEVSSHPDDVPIALPPPWLLDLLTRQPAKAATAPPFPERIPEGRRHHWLVSLAGTLRRRGASAEELFACLAVFNHSRCDPPLSDAELRTIATSMVRYSPAQPCSTAWTPGTTRHFVVGEDAW
jgi:putative DNA primase/helicase